MLIHALRLLTLSPLQKKVSYDSKKFLKHTRFRSEVGSGKCFCYARNLLRFTWQPKGLQEFPHGLGDWFLQRDEHNAFLTIKSVPTSLKSNKPINSLRRSMLSGLEIKSPRSRLSILVQLFRKTARLRAFVTS